MTEETKTTVKADDKELAEKISQLIAAELNPSLASHGGSVELVELKENVIYLKMAGGCQGCAHAKATLQNYVAATIQAGFPMITEVIDVTEHAAGDKPYY